MVFSDDNPHPLDGKAPISWHGTKPPGRAGIACPPEEPDIRAALTQNYLTCRIAQDGYEIINKKGDTIELPFSSPIADWIAAATQLGAYEANEPIEGTELPAPAND